MRFKKLTDKQCSKILTHLPKPNVERTRVVGRTTINGIVIGIHRLQVDVIPKQTSQSTAQKIPRYLKENNLKKRFSRIIRSAYKQNKFSMKKIADGSTTIPGKNIENSVVTEMKRLLV